MHENYFQHNILEAGAALGRLSLAAREQCERHRACRSRRPISATSGSSWRPLFYDVSDPRRRALHRGYIRQCLDNFADCTNVIQLTSAEFSGPLEFTQFWLDTIIEWQREKNRDVVVGLSAPKNVQDAILADPLRGPAC